MIERFEGVKVFSATKALERERLGDVITDWIKANPGLEIVDRTITQSSDQAFHCLTITLWFRRKEAATGKKAA
jgi:hypothetical protein